MTKSSLAPVSVVNGWTIFAHPLFLDQIERLIGEEDKLRRKDAQNFLGIGMRRNGWRPSSNNIVFPDSP